MKAITRDPLLAVAKGLLLFLMGIVGVATLACLVAIPVIILGQGRIASELVKQGITTSGGDFVGAVLVMLVFVVAMLGVLFQVFRLLKQVVDTVAQGDPFVPENARRLTVMAWLSLAVQIIALPIAAMGLWIDSVSEGGNGSTGFHFESGISGNGLLLMLVLFILARVFRKGAEMRAEIEGTV